MATIKVDELVAAITQANTAINELELKVARLQVLLEHQAVQIADLDRETKAQYVRHGKLSELVHQTQAQAKPAPRPTPPPMAGGAQTTPWSAWHHCTAGKHYTKTPCTLHG